MRTETKTIKIYKFEELSEEVKRKVIEEEERAKYENGFYFMREDMEEELQELLKKYKLNNTNNITLYYSLNYCQGDGVCFIGDIYYKNIHFEIVKNNHHYNHKYTCTIEYNYTEEEHHRAKTIEKYQQELENIYYDICDKLEKYGYDYIDYQLSDECIIEDIKMNECEFLENGEIYKKS